MAKKKETGLYDGFKTAAEILAEEEAHDTCISVGPNLDDALGGGLSSGFISLRTHPKCGKTTWCMHVAKNALKQGRKVYFFDAEGRLHGKKYLILEGFDPSDPNFYYEASTRKKILSAEYILTKQIQLMHDPSNEGAVYIIDSLSKLVAQDALDDKEVSGARRSSVPKTQTDWMGKAGNLIRISRSIVIGIQHLQVDQGARSYTGPVYKAKGADGFDYEADIVIETKDKPKDLDGNSVSENDSPDGLSLRVRIPYNKRRGPVNTKEGITTFIKFGHGVWFARELFDQLLKHEYCITMPDGSVEAVIELTSKAGGWYTVRLPDQDPQKVQGINGVVSIIENNIDYFTQIHADAMNTKYGAKYDFKPSK